MSLLITQRARKIWTTNPLQNLSKNIWLHNKLTRGWRILSNTKHCIIFHENCIILIISLVVTTLEIPGKLKYKNHITFLFSF